MMANRERVLDQIQALHTQVFTTWDEISPEERSRIERAVASARYPLLKRALAAAVPREPEERKP